MAGNTISSGAFVVPGGRGRAGVRGLSAPVWRSGL